MDEFISKKVERRGNKWCVIHCHGKDKGKPIKCFNTREEAEKMHRAIQANKGADIKMEKKKDERPPKAWFDRCVKEVSKVKGVTDPQALCGWVYYHHAKIKPKEFDLSDDEIKAILKEYDKSLEKDVINQIAILKKLK